jgi:hypothetical protein
MNGRRPFQLSGTKGRGFAPCVALHFLCLNNSHLVTRNLPLSPAFPKQKDERYVLLFWQPHKISARIVQNLRDRFIFCVSYRGIDGKVKISPGKAASI